MKKLVILMGVLVVLTGCQEKKDGKFKTTSATATTSVETSKMTTQTMIEQGEGNNTSTTVSVKEDEKITTNTVVKNITTSNNNRTTKTSSAYNPTTKSTTKKLMTTTKKATTSTKTTTTKKPTTTTKKVTTVSKLTEKEVYNKMIALKNKYPTGTKYDDSVCYEWKGTAYTRGCGCAGFAFTLSDAAFGSAKAKKHTDVSKIRVGDILRMYNDTHSVIVLEVTSTGVVVAEGNMTITGVFENGVYWGRKITKDELMSSVNYIYTRW